MLNHKTSRYHLIVLCSSISLSLYTVNYAYHHHASISNTIAPINKKQCSPNSHPFNLLTVDKKPSNALLYLLKLLGISHDGTLADIIRATQAAWLRKPGSERWEMEQKIFDNIDEIIACLTDIGCIETINPTGSIYDYALLLGATVHTTRTRLATLIDAYNKGIVIKQIVVLVGARPLDPTIESLDALQNSLSPKFIIKKDWTLQQPYPTTEFEMTQMIFDQAEFPAGFDKIPVIFVNTPMQQTASGDTRRPNTRDTIEHWSNCYQPTAGSCLVISNQPYSGYQDAAVKTYLPESFSVETVGQCARDPYNKIPVLLDNIARWLYQENELLKKTTAQ